MSGTVLTSDQARAALKERGEAIGRLREEMWAILTVHSSAMSPEGKLEVIGRIARKAVA